MTDGEAQQARVIRRGRAPADAARDSRPNTVSFTEAAGQKIGEVDVP